MASFNLHGDATHVTFEPWLEKRLSQIGATDIVHDPDCLVVGPSRRNHAEHAEARQAWWSSLERWDRLYLSPVRWEPPVVLWVAASLHQRVNLWRTCSWLRHQGLSHHDVLILEFEPVQRSKAKVHAEARPPFNCSSLVSEHPDELLVERLDQAHPWTREHYDRAVLLWSMYADTDPLPFVESCVRGAEGFPELTSLWVFLSCFFPRRSAEGALRPSRFDELVLNLLSSEWQTPAAIAVHMSPSGMDLWQLLSCTGDLFLSRRLRQWAEYTPSMAVERAPGPRPDVPMKSSAYRLTERGLQLRARGLSHLSDAPGLPVAGTEAYAPASPWVLLEDGRLASL